MDDASRRLIKCFQVVFPGLSEASAAAANQETVENWDSIASITLGNVVEEEFGVPMDYEALPELNSFGRMLEWVQAQARPA